MITLRDFLELAMDDCYTINIYSIGKGKEIHQKEVSEIMERDDIIDEYVRSWDIEYTTKELCINID